MNRCLPATTMHQVLNKFAPSFLTFPLPRNMRVCPLRQPMSSCIDFRGLGKIEKAFVPLLDEICSCHSSLIECQRKHSPKFIESAFTALGRVLHFLKTRKVKDMTDDVCADLELLWKELQTFKFDLAWVEPHVQRALRMNKLVKRAAKLKRLRKDVDDLEIEKKRLRVKLELVRRDLENAEGVEEIDVDAELGYGG